jgi:hypothetical protein
MTTSYTATVTADSPAAFLTLQETSGTAASDVTGHGHNGVYTGATLAQANLDLSLGDKSVSFDGSTTHVLVTGYDPFVLNGSQTFEGWAIRTSTAARHAIFGGNGGTGAVMLAALSGSTDVSFWNDTTTGQVTWTAACPTATAFHWALTYNDSTKVAELFVNGVSQGTQTLGQQYNVTGTNVLDIGNWVNTNWWLGRQSHFAVWASILSAAQILAHYNSALIAARARNRVVIF